MPTIGVWNLPSCVTKDAVFRMYQEEMKEKKRPCPAKSTFLYSMWKEQFEDVVIPKVRKCLLLKFPELEVISARFIPRRNQLREFKLLDSMLKFSCSDTLEWYITTKYYSNTETIHSPTSVGTVTPIRVYIFPYNLSLSLMFSSLAPGWGLGLKFAVIHKCKLWSQYGDLWIHISFSFHFSAKLVRETHH